MVPLAAIFPIAVARLARPHGQAVPAVLGSLHELPSTLFAFVVHNGCPVSLVLEGIRNLLLFFVSLLLFPLPLHR